MADTPRDRPEAPVVPVTPEAAVAPTQPRGDGAGAAAGGGFGLPVAIALIMGSIIGVGIFNLPTSLAEPMR